MARRPASPDESSGSEPAGGALPRYVHVRRHRSDGYVEFDFALGEPQLSLELVLPEAAFAEFCAAQRVIFLSDSQMVPNQAPDNSPEGGTT